MNYLKYIFENEDVRTFTESHEEEIKTVISENMDQFVITNFKYIVENMNQFIDLENLETSHENIKNFIAHDLTNMLSAIAEVAALDEGFDHVHAVMEENVASTFFGSGFGVQKSQRLITSTYV